MIAWITLTNGRKEYLSKARPTWYDNMSGSITKEYIVDDSGNMDYRQWLKDTYPSATIVPVSDNPAGYTKAMQKCFEVAINSECKYILHTEDDFLLNIKVDFDELADVLKDNKYLSQIVLQRQSWYEWEKNAPTYIDAIISRGEKVYQSHHNNITLSEHTFYWSCNPNIYPIEIAKLGWPDKSNSELVFTKKVMDLGYKSALLGDKYVSNHVTHIGENRYGFGH